MTLNPSQASKFDVLCIFFFFTILLIIAFGFPPELFPAQQTAKHDSTADKPATPAVLRPTLTELEQAQIQLARERLKSQAGEAALIRNAWDKNQQEGQRFVQEETTLTAQICKAHGLGLPDCVINPGGTQVTPRNAPTAVKSTISQPSAPVPPAKK